MEYKDARPRRDLPRNGSYLGAAGGGCAVLPAGRLAVFSHFEQSTKQRRVAAPEIEAALVHQRFMGSAFAPIAVAHHDEHVGGQVARGHEACPWSAAASDRW